MKNTLIALFTCLFGLTQVNATVTLPRLISNGIVLQRGTPIPVWGWAAAGESVAVTFNGNTYNTVTGADGKWQVTIPAMTAGGPYTMNIVGTNSIAVSDILIGDVYFCSGQSNMAHVVGTSSSLYGAEIASSANTNIRHFRVTKTYSTTVQEDIQSTNGWQSTTPTTVLNFTAIGYFFARDLYAKYGVPIGLINNSYEGTPAQAWMSPAGLTNYPNYLSQAHNTTNPEWDPMVLYNAMVAPLLKVQVKGILWYQGESNRLRAYEYRGLFPALINDWRTKFAQGNIPFLYVQLANYLSVDAVPEESNVAECREAQTMALSLPNTAMAVIHDTNTDTITHPLNKKDGAIRLSLAAQNMIYGDNAVVYKSPSYQSMSIQGNKIVISFNDIGGGLVARNGALQRFAIAGTNRKFVYATATIVGNTVEVSSPLIANPVAVRYAWTDNPMGANLYNAEGIPANSFRTDKWSGLTYVAPAVSSTLATPFTPGNLIVYRYSTDDATKALSSSTVPVYVDEFSTEPSADPKQSLAIPTTTVGANFRLTGLPKTGSPLAYAPEGLPTLSQDGQYLTLFGYDQAVGSFTTGSVNRVIARIDNAGNINSTTTVESALGQPRSAIANGNNFYVAGNTNGVRLTTLGSTATTTQVASNPGASRSLGIFNNKLYCFIGDTKLYSFNNLPTTLSTSSSTAALTGAVGNNQSVLFDTNNDGTPDLMYMADDGAIATPQNAALRKYVLVGSSWVAKGSITVTDTALIHGLKSITGTAVNGDVQLYAATWGNQTSFAPSMLLKFTDAGAASSTLSLANSSAQVLAVADTNSMFRGVTFTPGTTASFVLPVSFISFTAKKHGTDVLLNWKTATEKDNAHFNIMRSANSVDFAIIGNVAATNNINGSNYFFIDKNPLKGMNYYKLQQVDVDGRKQYSETVIIKNETAGGQLKIVSAASGSVQCFISTQNATEALLTVCDVLGRKIVHKKVVLNEGNNQVKLDGNFAAGSTYILSVTAQDLNMHASFIH